MQFPIDVVFLDRDLSVLRVVPALPPWRAVGRRGAAAVLELAAGVVRCTRCRSWRSPRLGDGMSTFAVRRPLATRDCDIGARRGALAPLRGRKLRALAHDASAGRARGDRSRARRRDALRRSACPVGRQPLASRVGSRGDRDLRNARGEARVSPGWRPRTALRGSTSGRRGRRRVGVDLARAGRLASLPRTAASGPVGRTGLFVIRSTARTSSPRWAICSRTPRFGTGASSES